MSLLSRHPNSDPSFAQPRLTLNPRPLTDPPALKRGLDASRAIQNPPQINKDISISQATDNPRSNPAFHNRQACPPQIGSHAIKSQYP